MANKPLPPERLTAIMKARNIDKKEVARLVGTTVRSVERWLVNGIPAVNLALLEKTIDE